MNLKIIYIFNYTYRGSICPLTEILNLRFNFLSQVGSKFCYCNLLIIIY